MSELLSLSKLLSLIGLQKEEVQRLREENKELRERVEELEPMTGIFSARLAEKYKKALKEIRDIVTGSYELLDPQAKKEIEGIVNKVL